MATLLLNMLPEVSIVRPQFSQSFMVLPGSSFQTIGQLPDLQDTASKEKYGCVCLHVSALENYLHELVQKQRCA